MLAFCDYYNDHIGRTNHVKNALLIQSHLKSCKIDFVIVTQDLLFEMTDVPYLSDFLASLDYGAILFHQYFEFKADIAADGWHGGKRCHGALAVELLDRFGRSAFLEERPGWREKVQAHVTRLRTTDQDWSICTAHVLRGSRSRGA